MDTELVASVVRNTWKSERKAGSREEGPGRIGISQESKLELLP